MNLRASSRLAVSALLPFALHGLARTVDKGVGLLLHTSLDLPNFVPLALGLVDPIAALQTMALWTATGALLWLALAGWCSRSLRPAHEDLAAAAVVLAPLYLRPVLTLTTLLALAWQPLYPYGFTLPVALTQDWEVAQDLASVAALVSGVIALGRVRRTEDAAARSWMSWTPHAWELGLVAFLGFALLTPERARMWDGHPGNEPKYLRMAVALGHFGSLDVTVVCAPMEDLATTTVSSWISTGLLRVRSETGAFLEALVSRAAWRPDAVQALPQAHLTVRALDEGAYHVLAPGPSLLLAPALRLDRALNRARGTPGRLAVALLVWNALAAALVAALYGLARDTGVRPAAAALVALATALSPPLLFYFYQFYPEVPAALLLVVALRRLVFGPRWAWRTVDLLLLGLTLMPLPWLHQKYLPVWAALTLVAVLLAVDRMVSTRALAALLFPQAVTLAAMLYYNFTLTGSPRPDALFRALGRTGVGGDTLGQGALGLLLDARYGVLPYVPWLLLALGALALRRTQLRSPRIALPIAAVYYLTVAAATNWTGSISNLGRFVLPLVPLAAVLVALVLDRAWDRSGTLTLALTLAAWSGALALSLWRDPLAANDSGVLLAQASFADGHVYLPNLLLRRWSDGAPGLWAQLAAWGVLLAASARFLRRASRGGARSPTRLLAGLTALLLVLGFGLEHWPSARHSAVFETLRLDDENVLIIHGNARVDGDSIVAEPGFLELMLRTRAPALGIEVLGPAARVLAFEPIARLQGRRGNRETLARQTLQFEQASTFRVRGVRK